MGLLSLVSGFKPCSNMSSSHTWFRLSFCSVLSTGQPEAMQIIQNSFGPSCGLGSTTSGTVVRICGSQIVSYYAYLDTDEILVATPDLGADSDVMRPSFFTYNTSVYAGCPSFTDPLLTGDANMFVDGLAKSFYALMLTDLGRNETSNILSDPHMIMQLQTTSPFQPVSSGPPPSDVLQNETAFFNWFGSVGEYSDGVYGETIQNPLKAYGNPGVYTSIPAVHPAVLATQYFCQVPQLKSIGSLLIAIIVADLVFLQALWRVLNLVVTFHVTRRNPQAEYCKGCAKQELPPQEGYALVNKAEEEQASENKLPQSRVADVGCHRTNTF